MNSSFRASRFVLAAAALVSLAACSSSNDTGGGGSSGPVTFTQVYSETLSAICTQCHIGASAPGGLDMGTKASAYQNLVGVKAGGPQSVCASTGLTRVVAGNAEQSLMYLKVSGTQPCGGRMPLDHAALGDGQISDIETWINDGAKDD